jgi:putative phosphoesterase
VRLAIVADTHMPRGKRRLPPACIEAISAADLVIHAGDFSEPSVLDEIAAYNPNLHAVHGNVDEEDLRRSLPSRTVVEAAGARIGVIHDSGPAKGRLARMRREFPDCQAVVFGHSHIPLHEQDDGFQIFNPGSPTERRRSPRHSFGIAEAVDGTVAFELLWVEPASQVSLRP